jgi:dTDP-4-amino-4,6-dideoxygalactose transaminase
MNKIIPYGKQDIKKEDINAVVKVLKSQYITQGPLSEEFEKNFSNYVNSKFSISVANGTAALHLSLIALGLKPGDKVITTPLTFVATPNAVRYCGGEVFFVDIDINTFQINFEQVIDLVNSYPKGYFKGVISVNFSGRVNNLENLSIFARQNGLWILEDSCHSLGGHYFDSNNNLQKSGNCSYSDLSIFSFHPVKQITSGEGGIITTNNEKHYDLLKKLRSHGIEKNKEKFRNKSNSELGWFMEMQYLGYNYRISDINLALVNSQLTRSDSYILKRKKIAKFYFNFFKNKAYLINQSGYIEGHSYHLYIILVKKRNHLYEFLKEKGIITQIHYIPAHKMPYYEDCLEPKHRHKLINIEKYYRSCISLPIFPTLSLNELNYITKCFDEFYDE